MWNGTHYDFDLCYLMTNDAEQSPHYYHKTLGSLHPNTVLESLPQISISIDL